MADYSPLVRDSKIPGLSHLSKGESNNDDQTLTKEQLVQELDNQAYKLSQFIDHQFLESCLAPVKNVMASKDENKKISVEFFNSKSTSFVSHILGN